MRFDLGGPPAVVLGQIERTVAELFRADANGHAKPRAYTMNLVAIAAAEDAGFATDVDAVCRRLAVRTLLLVIDAARDGSKLQGSVRAVCELDPAVGQEVVCAERIELMVGAAEAARLRSIVGALMEGRLPTVLYAGAGASPDLVVALSEVATTTVMDSSTGSLLAVRQLADRVAGRLVDLGQVRLGPWQEALAGVFDGPAWLPALAQIRRVKISQVGAVSVGADSCSGLLLLGWLGAQLGWRASLGRLEDRRGQLVSWGLRTSPDAAPGQQRAGGLAAVRLETELQGEPALLTVQRSPDGGHLCRELAGPRQPQLRRCFAAPQLPAAELAGIAISVPRDDRPTRAGLRLAARLGLSL